MRCQELVRRTSAWRQCAIHGQTAPSSSKQHLRVQSLNGEYSVRLDHRPAERGRDSRVATAGGFGRCPVRAWQLAELKPESENLSGTDKET